MPSSDRASYSPHSRWETVGFGDVCDDIPYVRVSTGWPPAAGGGGQKGDAIPGPSTP